MKLFQQWAFNMAKPLIKKWIKDELEHQKPVIVNYLKEKIDIPKLTATEETDMYVKIYSALELAADNIIDRV